MKNTLNISEHPTTQVHESTEAVQRLKTPDELICRICFDGESENKFLIAPCKCTGSMRSVHEECLKKWIVSSEQDIKLAACDICKEKFQMDIQLTRTCSCDIASEECFKIFIFPLAIIIIATILSIVLIYLAEGVRKNSLGTEEKIYFSMVIAACVIIQTTLIWVLVKSILATCCPLKMKDWSIISVKRAAIFEETFEVTHNDELLNKEIENANISPKTATYKGMNVVVPILQLKTENLENSAFIAYSVDRSGPQTERLPETGSNHLTQRMFTARILK